MIDQFEQHLQQLQLYCSHKSNHVLAGHYHSAFKGHGIEFDEVRPYHLGDDVRSIDWNVTARTGEVHIKRFHEERELNLIFVVDNSPSFTWSTGEPNRLYVAAQFCGLLGSAALANNDRIGMLQFAHEVSDYIPPKRGRSQLMRCLSQILIGNSEPQPTDFTSVLERLAELRLKSSILVIVSDFLSDQNFQESLAILAMQHEVLAIAIDDPRELSLPMRGRFDFADSEQANHQQVDFSDPSVAAKFAEHTATRLAQRNDIFRQSQVDLLQHQLTQDPVETLLAFYQARRQRIDGETGG